jgi:hypothetical protein
LGKIKLDIPHTLPADEAKKRVEALFNYWGRKYGVKATWSGEVANYAGKVMGISFDGQLSVLAGKIAGEAIDPGFLLRGQAQKYLMKKFGDYLDPKKTPADLERDD